MKKYKFSISGNDYDVHIRDIEDNIAELDVNGHVNNVRYAEWALEAVPPDALLPVTAGADVGVGSCDSDHILFQSPSRHGTHFRLLFCLYRLSP